MPTPSEQPEGEGVATCEHGIRHPWACDECDRQDLQRLHAAAPHLAMAAREYLEAASAIIGSLIESADLDEMDRIAANKWSHAEQRLEAALSRLTKE